MKRFLDTRERRSISSGADEIRIEARHITFERCGIVSRWIDGDENEPNTRSIAAERGLHARPIGECCRADVWTVRVTEEQQNHGSLFVRKAEVGTCSCLQIDDRSFFRRLIRRAVERDGLAAAQRDAEH